jgi:hypothetical protein
MYIHVPSDEVAHFSFPEVGHFWVALEAPTLDARHLGRYVLNPWVYNHLAFEVRGFWSGAVHEATISVVFFRHL